MAFHGWRARIRATSIMLLLAAPAAEARSHHQTPDAAAAAPGPPAAPDRFISSVPATSAVMLDAIPPESLPLASGSLDVGARARRAHEFHT